jgi:hypothetical protein
MDKVLIHVYTELIAFLSLILNAYKCDFIFSLHIVMEKTKSILPF